MITYHDSVEHYTTTAARPHAAVYGAGLCTAGGVEYISDGITWSQAISSYTAQNPTVGWNDLVGDISVRGVGLNDPVWAAFNGGLNAFSFSATAMTECWVMLHPNHDFKPGSPIYLHTHWLVTGTNAGVVRWGFEYSFANGYNVAAFPAPTTVYVEQAATGVALTHMIAETGPLTMTGIDTDAIITYRVFRDGAHANDTQTSAAFLLTSDAHHQTDHIYTPNRNAPFY